MLRAAFALACVVALVASIGTANARVSCQRVGNQTYCSDGRLYDHFGSTTYDRNGHAWEQVGSQVRGSDGRLYNRSGNQTYDSRGKPFEPLGNQTNEPTAGSCERLGNMVSCK